MIEIHAVDTAQERQRQKDDAHYGEALHDLVGAVADERHVEVERLGKDIAIDQQVLQHVLDRTDHVVQERLRRLADEDGAPSRQVSQHGARRQENLAKVQQVGAKLGDSTEHTVFDRGGAQLVLQLFDALLHLLLN